MRGLLATEFQSQSLKNLHELLNSLLLLLTLLLLLLGLLLLLLLLLLLWRGLGLS